MDLAVDLSSPNLALPSGRPVNSTKVEDVKKQIPFIPWVVCHSFYNSITTIENSDISVTSSAAGSEDESNRE